MSEFKQHDDDAFSPTDEHIGRVQRDDGEIVYALVSQSNQVACELTIKRAIELQREGLPYEGRLRFEAEFDAFYGGDIPPLDASVFLPRAGDGEVCDS